MPPLYSCVKAGKIVSATNIDYPVYSGSFDSQKDSVYLINRCLDFLLGCHQCSCKAIPEIVSASLIDNKGKKCRLQSQFSASYSNEFIQKECNNCKKYNYNASRYSREEDLCTYPDRMQLIERCQKEVRKMVWAANTANGRPISEECHAFFKDIADFFNIITIYGQYSSPEAHKILGESPYCGEPYVADTVWHKNKYLLKVFIAHPKEEYGLDVYVHAGIDADIRLKLKGIVLGYRWPQKIKNDFYAIIDDMTWNKYGYSNIASFFSNYDVLWGQWNVGGMRDSLVPAEYCKFDTIE